jgi:esterase/lipase superfamily enzyme
VFVTKMRIFFAAAALLLLGACGLKIPDPVPYLAGCATSDFTPAPEGEAQFFFLSAALPDCRTGALTMAPFRHPTLTYGSGLYGWEAPREPLPPVLAQHAKDQWLAAIEQQVAAPAAKGRLLVFIHGYNTTFDEAHEMAARIGELAGKEVPVVVLHWPTREGALSYAVDEATISWAQGAIDDALAELTVRAEDITIVSHSMGARAVIRSVVALDGFRGARPDRVRRIVLASADEDRDRVLRKGGSADELLRYQRQVLVYASYRDAPLDLSRIAHGYARLGSTDCKYDILFARRILGKLGNCHRATPRAGLAMVSTSLINAKDRFDHNDFIEDCRTRADFAAFLRDAPPPPFRRDIGDGDLAGYEIAPDVPDPDGQCSDDDAAD